MPENELSKDHLYAQNGQDEHEAQSLLSTSSEEQDLAFHPEPLPSPIPSSDGTNGRRHSAISQPTADGKRRTPRTMNRVRFDLQEEPEDARRISIERALSPDDSQDDTLWLENEDYELDIGGPGMHHSGQSIPLLTNIEAPSVTLATSDDFFPEDHLEDARPRSGMKMAFMNMANSIIGAGIIGQPYALRQAGDYAALLREKWAHRDLSCAMGICIRRMVAFCIIVGDTIPHVLGALFPFLGDMPFLWLLTDRRAVIVLFILAVSYPLSLYRDIAKLAKASALALVSMVVIVVTVITQGFQVPPESRGEIKSYLIFNIGFFQAVGVISFAFFCHHNSLLIYGSLKKPTLDRFTRVTHYSTGISLVMCLAMGIAGFLSFGSKTQGNVLNNFPSDNIVVNIARFCFGLNMLTTLPLEAFVCRSVMTTYYFPNEPHNAVRHVIFTTALVVTSMVLSLITCDLGSVFELIGATSAAALAYIFPPLCYIKLSSATWREKIPAYICICFGVLVMAVSLVQAVIKIIRN
ncbi:hypothetical protein PDIDSM_4033 [Penicillium digitatum]|nr:hypothetical protein PDIDSM_4033 [Penicillium digitatum]